MTTDSAALTAIPVAHGSPRVLVQSNVVNIRFLLTLFKESDGNGFLWPAHMSHITNMLFIAHPSSAHYILYAFSVEGLLLHTLYFSMPHKYKSHKFLYVVFFHLGDSLASEFYVVTFWNTVCSSSIGGEDGTDRVF